MFKWGIGRAESGIQDNSALWASELHSLGLVTSRLSHHYCYCPACLVVVPVTQTDILTVLALFPLSSVVSPNVLAQHCRSCSADPEI